ncbi:MAG: hypothetical protein AB7G87_07630 [Clostridia bacterium]
MIEVVLTLDVSTLKKSDSLENIFLANRITTGFLILGSIDLFLWIGLSKGMEMASINDGSRSMKKS